MEDEKEPSGMRVVDKRRFDSDGNEREDEQKPSLQSKVEAKLETEAPPTVSSHEEEGDEGELTLASFVMSLATQAMMQLGEIPPPPGVRMEKNIGHAKQTIDILSMLFEKTKGNRDEGEEKLFDDILHSLRISFIKAAK